MQTISKACSVALAVGLSIFAGSALAQECACRIPLTAGTVGQIVNATGDVRVAQATNYTPASSGAVLGRATRIIVGRGSASVRLGGGCEIALGANSSLTLIPTGGSICAAVERGQTAAFRNTRTLLNRAPAFNVGTALGVAGGSLLLAGGVILFTQDEDAPPVSAE
jgi:hypothetical protein